MLRVTFVLKSHSGERGRNRKNQNPRKPWTEARKRFRVDRQGGQCPQPDRCVPALGPATVRAWFGGRPVILGRYCALLFYSLMPKAGPSPGQEDWDLVSQGQSMLPFSSNRKSVPSSLCLSASLSTFATRNLRANSCTTLCLGQTLPPPV